MTKRRDNIIAIIIAGIVAIVIFTGCQEEERVDPANDKNEDKVIEDGIEENANEEDAVEDYGVTINDDSVSLLDGQGDLVTIDKNPERTVILYNSYLDIWMRNGGNVVGKLEDTVGDEPIPNTEDVEILGKFGAISLEKLISVEPELVIINAAIPSQMELVTPLEENGIQVVALDYKGKEDYFTLVRLFSAINERDDLFEENAIEIENGINEIISKVPEDEDIKVLVMVASANGIRARDSSEYVGLMLDDLKTINIADTSGGLLEDKNFSLEKIIEEDPDYIFVQTSGSGIEKIKERLVKDVESNPAWSSLSAVKDGRYIVLPKDLYMTKANHRYVEAYEGLAQIIYPEIFE